MRFPKPEPRATVKARRKRQQAKADRAVYVAVSTRARCEACGTTWDLHRHHLTPRSLGGQTTVENLALLCGDCHRKAHARTDNGRWIRGTR